MEEEVASDQVAADTDAVPTMTMDQQQDFDRHKREDLDAGVSQMLDPDHPVAPIVNAFAEGKLAERSDDK